MVGNIPTIGGQCWNLCSEPANSTCSRQDNVCDSVSRNVQSFNLASSSTKITNAKLYKENDNILTIYHQNICGIKSKINEFSITISEIKPHIICLTEHHLKDIGSNSTYLLNIPRYKLGAIYSRTSMRGGGVCIFVQEEIDYTDIDLQRYCKEQDLEIVAIKIKYLRTCFSIYCLYSMPSGNIEYFYEQLDSLLGSHLYIILKSFYVVI